MFWQETFPAPDPGGLSLGLVLTAKFFIFPHKGSDPRLYCSNVLPPTEKSSQLPPHQPSLLFDISCQSHSIFLLLVSWNLPVNLVLILDSGKLFESRLLVVSIGLFKPWLSLYTLCLPDLFTARDSLKFILQMISISMESFYYFPLYKLFT